MRRRLPLVAITIVFGLGAGRAYATDHAAAVLALTGEDAQCAYYLKQCRAGDVEGITQVAKALRGRYGRKPKCDRECGKAIEEAISAAQAQLQRQMQ